MDEYPLGGDLYDKNNLLFPPTRLQDSRSYNISGSRVWKFETFPTPRREEKRKEENQAFPYLVMLLICPTYV